MTAADVLDDVRAFVLRFCALPDEHALAALTLWAAHTHFVDTAYTTPRLTLLSPEPGSGKTRALEVLAMLVRRPLLAVNASPAAIFRSMAKNRPTLLFDEVDALWGGRGRDDGHEDLRALLNSGYKCGAVIPRCVGPQHDVVSFDVFGAVALAGLGDLPDTLMSRAVVVRMRRRAPGEIVDALRTRTDEPIGFALRDRLAAWAEAAGSDVGAAAPAMPAGIVDRAAELWEPLLAVADAAGGHWPVTARAACTSMCTSAQRRPATLGARLLADVRTIFGDAVAMHSGVIVDRLVDGDGLDADAPWGELHGVGLSKRVLARMLSKYGVFSTKVTVGGVSLQGYRREHMHDAWSRYLPSAPEEPEFPELAEEDAAEIPPVPDIPEARDGAACARCDGEGCGWCNGGSER